MWPITQLVPGTDCADMAAAKHTKGYKPILASILLIFLGLSLNGCSQQPEVTRTTFTYPTGDGVPQRRGGTTTGIPVDYIAQPRPAWSTLNDPELSPPERDRQAIRAMAGTYRADFEFLETVTLLPTADRDIPYASWATEIITIIEDTPERISLQHVLCMYFAGENGAVRGPAVVKHWRQDWTWQDSTILDYMGNDQWALRTLSAAESEGTWTQAVWGVADEPRYEAIGRWVHAHGDSYWESQPSWRPLPRREHTVREDYEVLESRHIHRITPAGWTHEQRNRKLQLDENGQAKQFIAVEIGHNAYRELIDFDDQAAHEYWQQTQAYWASMRQSWDAIINTHGRIHYQRKVDGKHFIMSAFAAASEITENLQQATDELVDLHVSEAKDTPSSAQENPNESNKPGY